jgi:hypothetical protein
VTLAVARHQWEDGTRKLDATGRDSRRYRQLVGLVEAVADELRRRVGQTYSLDELAAAYTGSEDWVRDVVIAATPARPEVGVRDVALVQDAAFGMYARGAVDYRP